MLSEPDTEADYVADSESILPLFLDRLGYGVEEEEYVQSSTRPRQVRVYIAGGGNTFDATLLTEEITAENVESRVAEWLSARTTLERQLEEVNARTARLASEQLA